MSQHSSRMRGRLLAATLGLALVTSTVAVGLPSPAAAIPEEGACFNRWYHVQANHGRVLSPTEPTHIVFNGNPGSIPVTFTSQQSGTRSTTVSASASVSGGFNIGVINTTVQLTFGIQTMSSATSSVGISVGPMTLPTGKYQLGDYGVWRQKTSGQYVSEFWCGQFEQAQITAFSVTGVGWDVWQEAG